MVSLGVRIAVVSVVCFGIGGPAQGDFFRSKASGLWEDKDLSTTRALSGQSGLYTQNCHVLKIDLAYSGPTQGGPFTEIDMSIRGPHGFSSIYDEELVGGSYTFVLPDGSTQTDYGVTYEDIVLNQPYSVHYCADPSAVLNGGNLAITISYKDNGAPKWVRYNLKIHKRLCAAASVDSRKGFMDPHADGSEEPSGNEFYRNLNFGSYLYRGGLFLGNMEWQGGDQSGLARILLWPASGDSVTTYMGMGVSLLGTGKRGFLDPQGYSELGFPSSVAYAASVIQNPAPVEGTATWDYQWTFTTTESDDTWVAPIATSDYTTWTVSRLDGGGNLVIPQNATTNLTIALEDEATESESWAYFAGDEYEALATSGSMNLGFPFTDCKPRLWIVDLVQVTNGP